MTTTGDERPFFKSIENEYEELGEPAPVEAPSWIKIALGAGVLATLILTCGCTWVLCAIGKWVWNNA